LGERHDDQRLAQQVARTRLRLRGRGDDAAVIAITAYSRESLADARKIAEAFADEHMAGIAADLERIATGEDTGSAVSSAAKPGPA
jgi:hypothetical protein